MSNNFILIHPIAGFSAVPEQIWGPPAYRLSSTHRSLLLQGKLAQSVLELPEPEEEGTTTLPNIRNYSPNDTASITRKFYPVAKYLMLLHTSSVQYLCEMVHI